MHRRARHLNPKAAGANGVFDARFGITVSDGSTIQTWSNRTGSNDATQSTASYRPTFRATGGNANLPTVEFDGTNDHLTHAVSITTAPSVMYSIIKRTASNSLMFGYGFLPPNTAVFQTMYPDSGGTGYWGATPGNSGQSILNEFKICTHKPSNANTSNSTTTFWTNGANETSATGSRYAGDGTDRRGLGGFTAGISGGERLTGSISLVVSIPSDITNSLRKRLEQAAGYCFKIACA